MEKAFLYFFFPLEDKDIGYLHLGVSESNK